MPQRYSALVFPPHQRLIFFILISYFNSTGASEKYVPAISPVINQDTLGGLCPMPDVRLEGFSPHRSSDRYYSSIISSGVSCPFLSVMSSIPRFYIGWNQNPFTSRCLMPVAGWSSANSILVKKFSHGGLILRTSSLVGRPGPSPGVPDEVPPEMLTAFCSWGWAGNLIHSCPGEFPIHMWKMPSLDPTTLGSTIFYVYSAPIRGKPLLDVPFTYLSFLDDR